MRRSLPVLLTLLAPLVAPSLASSQAITYLGDRANTCVTITAGAHSHILTLSSGITAGSTVIISAATSSNVTQTPAIFDSTGINSYTPDMSFAPDARAFVISSRISNALSTGQTITIPYSNSTGSDATSCAVVSVFSNLVPIAGYLDQVGNASATSMSLSVSTSAATAQANELVVGIFATTLGTGGFTNGSGYQAISAACQSPFCIFPEYKVVNATGVQTPTATTVISIPWRAIVATYKGCGPDGIAPSVTAPGATSFKQSVCN